MSKFKVGDRVRVIDCAGSSSAHIGDIVTVMDVWGHGNNLLSVYSPKYDSTYGMYDYRFETTTKTGETPVQRRTFKQLKESVTVRKNALWQEACDDGTQEYILLDQTNNKDSRNTQRIYDRSLVEADSANFVEVFAVTPQYMTRVELDQWEAFKAVKPERKARAKTTKAPKKVARVSKAKAA
ncbi:hypothetical protein [Rhodococcus sp. IEGM 1374]|uniref:hypothetical protein n=1 Tax=Rhodococcus sp. IEGM 1374 TaxID=3082221 RepID=UPI00295554AB|nr:hypothetical protein [Rhodococcus sp. IEGM 1374]MDV7992094.1 hypothetical protein [Rhodococcus sp. IEGM 1374]